LGSHTFEPAQEEYLLLDALARLSDIGAEINALTGSDDTRVDATLRLIVESAIQVVPGAAAVLYVYDRRRGAFDPVSRVSAGEWLGATAEERARIEDDEPRAAGLGMRAVSQLRPVLSYDEPGLGIHPAKEAAGAKVLACLPLVVAGSAVGVLYLYLREARRFTQLELLLLSVFVNQAAIVIYHADQLSDVQRALTRREDELSRLRRAGLLISSRRRPEETLEAILHMALEVTGAKYGILRLVDKQSQHLITRAVAGERLDRPAVEALPLNATSIMGWVARSRQPLNIADVQTGRWSRIYYPLDYSLEMRAELAVPLIGAGGRLEGVLNLESPQVGAFSEQDSHLLQAFATQAVIAIQEARLVGALQEVSARLLVEPSQAVIERLVELACDLLNASASAIWTLHDDTLILSAASAGYTRGDHLSLRGSLTGQAVLARAAVTSEDVRSDPRFERTELARAQGWTRALIVPLTRAPTRGPDSPPPEPVAASTRPLVAATGPRPEPAAASTGSATGARPELVEGPSVEGLSAEGPPVAGASFEGEPVGAFSVYGVAAAPEEFTASDWDKKVLGILAHYAALAFQNAARQDALREAQAARSVAETFAAMGDIAANLLHHLNNKVGTIPVRVEGIQDKCAAAIQENPYLAANLVAIERAALEAMTAVREQLALLRPINHTLVDVAGCVTAAIQNARLPTAIDITHQVASLPAVMAHRESLILVLVNLLQNAASAMQGAGAIAIEGTAHPAWVEIAVRDTGPGIAPELRDRIFEFNFSGQGASGRGNLGFGLWWVKTLMTRLGGAVSVESADERAGRSGATFRLRLPTVQR
jgi:signal transduction histidine kinase/putative methionine-R-sulfoxide reductase with GAF domain